MSFKFTHLRPPAKASHSTSRALLHWAKTPQTDTNTHTHTHTTNKKKKATQQNMTIAKVGCDAAAVMWLHQKDKERALLYTTYTIRALVVVLLCKTVGDLDPKALNPKPGFTLRGLELLGCFWV